MNELGVFKEIYGYRDVHRVFFELQQISAADLPDDNIEVQKVQHNKTIENYIKLGLEKAKTVDNLVEFCVMLLELMDTDANIPTALARDVLLIWVPAAEIAGLKGLKQRLEDKAFAILFPDEADAIDRTYEGLGGDDELRKIVGQYTQDINDILDSHFGEGHNHTVKGRKKTRYSIWRKCYKKGQTNYRLPDFFGMRVLVDGKGLTTEDEAGECWLVANTIAQYYDQDLDRLKDYVMTPKDNGYRSLHATLHDSEHDTPLELQVRTKQMHEKAEKTPGMSHIAYEASSKYTPFKYDDPRVWRIYKWRDEAAKRIRQRKAKGEDSLSGLFPNEILVFAPDKNLYQLPAGSTMLDFSFAIHSGLALGTEMIYVDDKPVKFAQKLEDGATVRVVHKNDQQSMWNRNWLEVVKTRKARTKIKQAINQKF